MSNYEQSAQHLQALQRMQGASNHLRHEREQLAISHLRVSCAETRLDQVRVGLIMGTPGGAGEATALTIPWKAITFSSSQKKWRCEAGKSIRDAVGELIQLARICGTPMTLVDVNGVDMTADGKDSFEAVLIRWRDAGGAAG